MKDKNGYEISVGEWVSVGKKHRFHSTPQFPFIGIVEAIRETDYDKHSPILHRPYMVVRVVKGVRMVGESFNIEPEYVCTQKSLTDFLKKP